MTPKTRSSRVVPFDIRGFVQVVQVRSGRIGMVLEPCVPRVSGRRIAASFNAACRTGQSAEVRPIRLPGFASDSAGKFR